MPIPEVSPSPAEVDALLKKLGLDASDLPEPPGGLALEAIRLGNELAVVRAKLASACSFQQGALAMRNRVVNYLQGRAVALGQRADWTERKDADNPFADRIVEEIRELVVGLDSEANTIQTFDPEKESAVEQGVGLIYREHERQPTRGTMTHAYPVSAQRGARQNRQHSSQTAGSVLCAAPSARVTTRPRQTRTVTLESH